MLLPILQVAAACWLAFIAATVDVPSWRAGLPYKAVPAILALAMAVDGFARIGLI